MKTLSFKSIGSGIIAGLGVLCCVIGAFVYGFFPSIIKMKVEEKLILKEGTTIYNSWVSPIVPVYMKFYLFNVTNPEDVRKNGNSPIVKEMGPYTYREYKVKQVIRWDDNTSTVTFREVNTFYFEQDLSDGSEDDVVMAVNMPMVGLVKLASDRIPYLLKPVTMPLVDNVLRAYGERLFVPRTVKELLFQGYHVDLVAHLTSIIKPFVPELPQFLPNNTFGLFYGRNNSDDGVMTVYTGADDISKYMKYYSWKGQRSLKYWKNKYCDMINGTDGRGFHPFVSKEDTLYAFVPDMCRSIPLAFEDDVTVNGIPAYRYMLPEYAFQDVNSNPDNMCFSRGVGTKDIGGIMPVSVCQKGRPVYVTMPHFYQTDERITERIKGLNPNKNRHQTFLDVEPTTGTAINVARRVQFNLEVRSMRDISDLSNIMDVLLPVFWLEELATITEEATNLFNAQVKTPIVIGKSVLISLMVLGVIWIFIALTLTFWKIWNKAKISENKVNDLPQHATETISKTILPPKVQTRF